MPFPKQPEEEHTHQAMLDPQPGDYFCEMCAFWIWVVERIGNIVITVETNGTPCILPDEGVWRIQTVQEFRDRFAYGSIDGYWVMLYGQKPEQVKGWKCPLDHENFDGELAP